MNVSVTKPLLFRLFRASITWMLGMSSTWCFGAAHFFSTVMQPSAAKEEGTAREVD